MLTLPPRLDVRGALAVTFLGVVCTWGTDCRMVFPNRKSPPGSLHKSAERVVEAVYAHLDGTNEEDDAKELYAILEPGVTVYCLFGPSTAHPEHHKGEYRVNLTQSRWHVTIYPARRRIVDGRVYEIWVLHYAGQGRWYSELREHRYYFGTVAEQKSSLRRIILRSNKAFEHYDAECRVKSLLLGNGQVVELPLIQSVQSRSTAHEDAQAGDKGANSSGAIGAVE